MRDYTRYTDEELIAILRGGEQEVIDFIIEKYKPMVRQKARVLYLVGGEQDDLIQEGMIGLFKAVRDYDSGRDASFYTFAELCISRQMYTALQASGRKKHSPLNTYVSIYQGHDGEEGAGLIEALENHKERNPEEILIDKENVEAIERIIENDLSTFERQVLELSMTGMGYVEIAKLLGKDVKSTDNALSRVKTKIRKALNRK